MPKRALAILIVLQVAAGSLFLWDAPAGFPLDDAWVHAVYARSLAAGDGFAYNPGQPEAGVTAPFWTVMAAIPTGLLHLVGMGHRPDLGLRFLGGLMGLAAAVAAYRMTQRAGSWPAAFAALVLTFDPLSLYGRFSGMEQPLFALLCFLLVGALVEDDARKTGLVAGLLCLTRPEGLLLAALAGAILATRRQPLIVFASRFLLCILPWMLYCLWITGRPYSNTLALKAQVITDVPTMGRTLVALCRDTGWGWALPILLVGGASSLGGGFRRLGRLPLGLGLALLAGVLATRALPTAAMPPIVPYYWERYALLAWPFLLVVVAAGLASVVRTAWAGVFCRPTAAAVLMAPLLVVLLAAWRLPGHAFTLRQRFHRQCSDVQALNVAAGRWIDQHLPADALVATHDAGAIRYFGNRPVLDVLGLHHGELAGLLLAGDANGVQRLLLRDHPGALVCFPAEWAGQHSPELDALFESRQIELGDYLQLRENDYAGPLGLTRRVASFQVDDPAVVPSPLHRDMAIFMAP